MNYVVQSTIDRILFLRICEDRNIEEYGRLQKLTSGKDIYKELIQFFHQADAKYNSGLFHFEKDKYNSSAPDEISLKVSIDDKILKEIITALYYPSPYEFSVITADILGNVYEQFLGKVIRLTAGGQAKVEEKPEVKKAGGVYYTPQYIVKYIVENTVGELLKGKTPMMVAGKVKGHEPLRIVDPACGSGSFLIYAYQYLLDWHRDWYDKDIQSKGAKQAKKWREAVYQGPGGQWYLTTHEKKQILLNNIFGVEIDSQAVEVTKLNLLLKVLEGENRETIGNDFNLFHRRALPDLSKNIKCGNSLIGSDLYSQINAFDWDSAFSEVFKGATLGFDAVVGNPPYVRQEVLGEAFKKYAKSKFQTYAGTADLYTYFIEKSLSLLNESGLFSIIVANKWMRANYGEALRRFLKTKRIHEIIDFGDLPVFTGATTYPCIIKLSNAKPAAFSVLQVKDLDFEDLSEISRKQRYPVDEETKNRLIAEDSKSAEVIKPFLAGRDVKRYQAPHSEKFLIFTRRGINIKDYPAIEKYLLQYKERLMPKPKGFKGSSWKGRKPGSYEWYEIQDSVDYFQEFEKKKIIVPAITQRGAYSPDENAMYSNDKTSIVITSDKNLIGVLNSKTCDYFLHTIASTKQGGYFEYKPMYISLIPIALENAPVTIIENISSAVEQMLTLNKQAAEGSLPPQKAEQLKRQIDATDREIDKLVYQLYGLTDEEIRLIEDSLRGKEK